jgi:hypothetical protein
MMTRILTPVQHPTEPSPRVTDRRTVSQPDRVIQVERVSVSKEQQSSVTTAIRVGQQSGRDSK